MRPRQDQRHALQRHRVPRDADGRGSGAGTTKGKRQGKGGDRRRTRTWEEREAARLAREEAAAAEVEADPEAAERVRSGNAKAVGPLVGFVMRETKGRADGGEVTRLIHQKLGAG